jgi:uncharacterized protein (TIGR02246 family)
MGQDIRPIERVVRAFGECWNRHDVTAFARLFAEDAEFVSRVGAWWKGRAAIEHAHRTMHATGLRDSRLALEGMAVRFVRADVAIARASWRLHGRRGPADEPLPEGRFILMTLLVRGAQGWRIRDAQNTEIDDRGEAAPVAAKRRPRRARRPRRRSRARATP